VHNNIKYTQRLSQTSAILTLIISTF